MPEQVGPTTAVECRLRPELEAQGAQYKMRWLRNGELAGQGARLAGPHAPGDVLTCDVTVRSGKSARQPRETKVVRALRAETVVHTDRLGENIVLIILDDVGVERVGAYGVEGLAPETPNLDRLAERGVLFDNAYANPVCSPTRAGILTGLHSQNHGLGTAISEVAGGLGFEAWTLPEALDELTGDAYHHAAVGKWHVSGRSRGLDNPVEHGFDRFAGTMANLADRLDGSYTDWTRVEHGRESRVRTYATTDTVDTALGYMEQLPEPFFLWVAFHASHTPFHVPPPELSRQQLGRKASVPDKFNAALTAMDTELGRMLSSMPRALRERTTFIVIGDNGTPQYAAEPPYDADRVKASVHEGGIRVPLIVMGPTVADPGRRSSALVSHVDVFPTVLDLAGASLARHASKVDGVSFADQLASPAALGRRYLYQESFGPNGRDETKRDRWNRVVRDRRWKYIRRLGGREELYDLDASHLDTRDLLTAGPLDPEAQDALDRLQRVMTLDYAPRAVPATWW